MGGEIWRDVTSVLTAIVGLAVLAVLVSRKSNTAGVISSAGSGFSNALATAEGPVTGYTPAPVQSSSGFLGLALSAPEFGAGYNSYGLA